MNKAKVGKLVRKQGVTVDTTPAEVPILDEYEVFDEEDEFFDEEYPEDYGAPVLNEEYLLRQVQQAAMMNERIAMANAKLYANVYTDGFASVLERGLAEIKNEGERPKQAYQDKFAALAQRADALRWRF